MKPRLLGVALHQGSGRLLDGIEQRTATLATEMGGLDAFARAKARVKELFASYQKPALPHEAERELRGISEREAKEAGMDKLPVLP